MKIRILSRQDVEAAVSMAQAIETVKQAFVQLSFDLDDAIVPARFEDLAVETRWPEEATDDLLVE